MNDFSPDPDLAVRDDVLQILFWLRGEGIGEDAGPPELARLTGLDEELIRQILQRLAAQGLVRNTGEERYALTDVGASEGGRRFADEFADLTKAGHGECNDPDCECKRTGNIEDCHVRRS